MKALRQVLVASLCVAALATGVVRAASTTNFSDQWWAASESGWGAAVLQQSDTLFIDLMVYGTDGKPTPNGAISIFENAKSTTGFTARFAGKIGACQVKDGRIVAVLSRP